MTTRIVIDALALSVLGLEAVLGVGLFLAFAVGTAGVLIVKGLGK